VVLLGTCDEDVNLPYQPSLMIPEALAKGMDARGRNERVAERSPIVK
jgi:hypothetical protein